MRAKDRRGRDSSSVRSKRFWDFSERRYLSPLDVLLELLAPLDDGKEKLKELSKHDYNFGMLLALVGVAFMSCIGFGLGCFLAALIIFA